WAGGLPEGTPPRPGTPEYDAFRQKQDAEAARDKSKDPPSEKHSADCSLGPAQPTFGLLRSTLLGLVPLRPFPWFPERCSRDLKRQPAHPALLMQAGRVSARAAAQGQ